MLFPRQGGNAVPCGMKMGQSSFSTNLSITVDVRGGWLCSLKIGTHTVETRELLTKIVAVRQEARRRFLFEMPSGTEGGARRECPGLMASLCSWEGRRWDFEIPKMISDALVEYAVVTGRADTAARPRATRWLRAWSSHTGKCKEDKSAADMGPFATDRRKPAVSILICAARCR